MRIAFILLLILNSAVCLAQTAEFSFEGKPVAKFGKIAEGEVVSHTFHFTNSGDVPLIISNYKVACACTQVEYPKEPILPGESASIKVSFDSEGKMGWQYRSIILFDNTKNGQTELEIQLKVIN